jgi:TonB family protein
MRSPLVITSVGLHIFAVSGLMIAGFWKLDRLEPGRSTFDLAVASPPAAAASGSPAAAKAEPFKRKKPPKVVARDIVQPDKREIETTRAVATANAPSDGTGGTGSGAGSGSGFDPIGTGTCAIPPCGGGGSGSAAPVTTKATPPIIVPPTVIKGLRTSGETQIHPPPVVKTTMLRDGASKVVATLRLCVGTDGEVSGVSVLKSSGYAGYDAALDDGLHRWHYRAYEVNGRKVPVCGVVTFVYSIK